MKRLAAAIALFSVGTELREGHRVTTTADRVKHHTTDTRNVISDFRNFYGVKVESLFTRYQNPISGRRTRYIDTYRLDESIDNLKKMDDVLHSLATEIEELKAAYSLKKEKLNLAA